MEEKVGSILNIGCTVWQQAIWRRLPVSGGPEQEWRAQSRLECVNLHVIVPKKDIHRILLDATRASSFDCCILDHEGVVNQPIFQVLGGGGPM